MNYTNPRTFAEFHDWPSGRERVRCTFEIEKNSRGERVKRTTFKAHNGQPCTPKLTTYARRVRIFDGDDGKTYLLHLTMYGHISVHMSDMLHTREAIFESDPRYASLFEQLMA